MVSRLTHVLRIFFAALTVFSLLVAPASGVAAVTPGKTSTTPGKTEVKIYLTTTGAGTWTVPADWDSASNTIEVIGGGGGGGGASNGAAGGGGGGAYSRIVNLSLTPGGSVTYQVGSGGGGGAAGNNNGTLGGDTYFNGTGSTCAAQSVCAKGGGAGDGVSAANGASAAGGASGSGVGSLKYSGGSGSVGTGASGGGGGGAGGPNGDGNAGNNGANGVTNSGSGDAGFGGAGGIFSTTAGLMDGNPGTEWDASHGSGGGGGGVASNPAITAGDGGLYGAGGGGARTAGSAAGGSGAQGLIVITYNASNVVNQLARGLVGYWPLDGNQTNWSTGQTQDLSGQANVGQFVGMSTTTSPVVGKIGQALKFTGANYVSISNRAALPTGSGATWTLAAWAKPSVIDGTTRMILSYGAGANNNTPHLSLSSTGFWRASSWAVANDVDATAGPLPEVGTWAYIVGTCDGTNIRLYVNGQLVAGPLAVTNAPVNSEAYIGVSPAATSFWKGSIDDARIYNYALSSKEVNALYGAGKATFNKAKRIYLTNTSLTSWTVPSDWNSSANTIEVIGGGGGGYGALGISGVDSGGGGGAYSKTSNVALTAGASVAYQVGSGGVAGNPGTAGGDTFFNRTAGVANTCADTSSVCAKGGSGSATGAGGAAGSGIGTVTYSGGTSPVNTANAGSGGGGAAGPFGDGGDGGAGNTSAGGGGGGGGGGTAGASSASGGAGGDNYLGFGGGAGGSPGTIGTAGGGGGGGTTGVDGGDGGNGTEWDASHGSGGGGGAAGHDVNSAFPSGGLYGGGGAGKGDDNNGAGGPGGQGIIVITYVPRALATRPDTSVQTTFTTFLTSGSTWRVPTNWNSASNTIEVIGGGGGAGTGGAQAGGGAGGGAYAKISNLSLTRGSLAAYQIGSAGNGTSGDGTDGGDTWFNGSGTTCATQSVCAKGGSAGLGVNETGQPGGQASASVGTVTYNGGDGGDANTGSNGGGGGGAAGMFGAGGNGGNGSGVGGKGDNNQGGAGGTVASSGNPGGNGTEWDSTHGSGGGGGGSSSSGTTAGAGGSYGGGGGGARSSGTGGDGGPGLIVIKYTLSGATQPTVVGLSNTSLVSGGLVGYWPFDGRYVNWATGAVSDISGQGNTGQIIGMSTSTSPVAGKAGQALKFGDGQYIEVPYSASLAPTTAVAVSVWFKYPGILSSVHQRFVSKTNSGGYSLFMTASGSSDLCNASRLCFAVRLNGAWSTAEYPVTSLRVGSWYHLVGVYNGSALKIYLNGAEVTSTADSGVIQYSSNNALCIGLEPDAVSCTDNRYNSGAIDDVRVYNRALSSREVNALYMGGK